MYEISIADRDCHYQRGRDLDTAWRLGIEQVPVCALPKLSCALPRRWAVLAAVMFAICLSCASQAQSVIPSPPEGKLPTLTTARQAHSLTSKEAMRAFPVHLRGVITYFDPDFGSGHPAIFIHDASGSIFVKQTSKLTEQLFAGALVDVRGVSAPGGFGPVVGNPRIQVLGRAPLPQTRRASALPSSKQARKTPNGWR